MEILSTKSLNEISGGGKTLWAIIGTAFAFFLGVFAGFNNPYACKK